jgi:hypothetical protein
MMCFHGEFHPTTNITKKTQKRNKSIVEFDRIPVLTVVPNIRVYKRVYQGQYNAKANCPPKTIYLKTIYKFGCDDNDDGIDD